jgi:hypothetical protein
MDVWVDNVRPTGPWPAVPWVAFGGPARYMTDRGPFSIDINCNFVADMSGVLLVISPNVELEGEVRGEVAEQVRTVQSRIQRRPRMDEGQRFPAGLRREPRD